MNEPCLLFSSIVKWDSDSYNSIVYFLPRISLILSYIKILNNFLQTSSMNCSVVSKTCVLLASVVHIRTEKEKSLITEILFSLQSSNDLRDLGKAEILAEL